MHAQHLEPNSSASIAHLELRRTDDERKRHPLPSKNMSPQALHILFTTRQLQYMYPALPARTYPVHLYFLWETGWLANRDRVHNTESLKKKKKNPWLLVRTSNISPSICYFTSVIIVFCVFFLKDSCKSSCPCCIHISIFHN